MLTTVADGVWIHQSEVLANNTVVVQGQDGVLLIDPGITDSEMVCLANDVRELGRTVVAGFATHPDWDHVLWHPALGDVTRHGTARCAAFMRELLSKPDWKTEVAEGLPPEVADDMSLDRFGLIAGLPAGAEIIPWDGPRVRIIEHQAHAPGHAALVIEDRRILVAGDLLSDVFVPMLDFSAADPIGEYFAALQLIEGVADEVDVFVPGHGSFGRAGQLRQRLDLDRSYLRALRDDQAVKDPRIGPSARPGWEWVSDVHEGQVQQLISKREQARAPE